MNKVLEDAKYSHIYSCYTHIIDLQIVFPGGLVSATYFVGRWPSWSTWPSCWWPVIPPSPSSPPSLGLFLAALLSVVPWQRQGAGIRQTFVMTIESLDKVWNQVCPRCMVVTTLVLSIISAILAGILTLIQIVLLFGLPKHHCYPCSTSNNTKPFNSSLPILEPEDGFEECCSRDEDEEGRWGPDTIVYLLLGPSLCSSFFFTLLT